MFVSEFRFEETELSGAYLITPFSVGDNRGGFVKIFEEQIYEEAGIEFYMDETFVSISAKNVIRGMHFQTNCPQAKLVSVLKGSAYDVIVDLRPESETYKQWRGFELNEENHKVLYVPRGFAHGFLAKEDGTQMMYYCHGAYDAETDTGILYDDAEINIKWPVEDVEKCIHSARDLELMSFSEYEKSPMKVWREK